jgi:hypothetical protein
VISTRSVIEVLPGVLPGVIADVVRLWQLDLA